MSFKVTASLSIWNFCRPKVVQQLVSTDTAHSSDPSAVDELLVRLFLCQLTYGTSTVQCHTNLATTDA